ncbi:MAG: flagellar basal body P-ring formation chaperone FlgA, partial [Gemmatimonadota bacterium]|nr:flagellar basal body P-ring formation chaperone FlgA [Gemmatimonadota bacterium]
SGYWLVRFSEDGAAVSAGIRVRVGTRVKTPVAGRTLARGEALRSADVAWREEVQWGEPAADLQPDMSGWVAQRVVREGEPLREPALRVPDAVTSGTAVVLVWEQGPVVLRVPGRAAGSAALGGTVYVRTSEGERLMGVVIAPGIVNVTQGGPGR